MPTIIWEQQSFGSWKFLTATMGFVGDSFTIVKGGQEGKYLLFLKNLLTHKKCNTPCKTFTTTEDYKFKAMLILLNVTNPFFWHCS